MQCFVYYLDFTTHIYYKHIYILLKNNTVLIFPINLHAANLPSLKIATFDCRTLKSDYRVLELILLVRKQCDDVLAIQEHRRSKHTLATDINIPTGYCLFYEWHTHLASMVLDL